MDELKWLLIGLFILFVLWGATGGMERKNREGYFIDYPVKGAPAQTFEELQESTRP